MPEVLDRCVREVMADPDFAPQEGRTPEESAFAICRSSLGLKEDGTEDEKAAEMDDIEMRRRVKEHGRRAAQAGGQPVLVKDIVIARAGRNFKNGDDEFDLTRDDIDTMVANFKRLKRQVPILLTPDHLFGGKHSNVPAAGWVDDLFRKGDDFMARVKFHGEAAVAVMNDQYRGISIGTVHARDVHGKPAGEALDHLLITNAPFFPDLNIAAVSQTGGELVYITARRRETMSDSVKKDDVSTNEPAAIKAKEQEIVALKGENLQLKEKVEDLEKALANARVDEDKEKLARENVQQRQELFAMKVRALVSHGLQAGTLKAAWCDGYAGKGPVDYDGTIRWLKASRFYDATIPSPETEAFRVLKWAVENNPPLYRLNQTYSTGTPKEAGSLTLTEEHKDIIRRLGLNPERISALKPIASYDEWKALKAESKS